MAKAFARLMTEGKRGFEAVREEVCVPLFRELWSIKSDRFNNPILLTLQLNRVLRSILPSISLDSTKKQGIGASPDTCK